MSVLAAIAVLAVLIFVHELGHFLAARLQGIYANRFSIGFGPILWKYQGSQTEYAIRALPLGGFVGFPDDDPDTDIPPNDPNLLSNRPLLDRAIVISAGVIANLIFAYLVLIVQVGVVGIPEASQAGVLVNGFFKVAEVQPPAAGTGLRRGDSFLIDGQKEAGKFEIIYDPSSNLAQVFTTAADQRTSVSVSRVNADNKPERLSFVIPSHPNPTTADTGIRLTPTPALKAGLRPGDVVLAANHHQFSRSVREISVFQEIIRQSAEKPVQFQILRGSETLSLTVTPVANADKEGTIGIGLSPRGEFQYRRVGGFTALSAAAEEFQDIVSDTLGGFGKLISNFSKTAEQVAGPVAIVAIGAKFAAANAASLLQFAALISINLAIINILPLPALDGGQLAFLLIEGVRGKPLPTHIQDGVMQTGLMLLLGLGVFLIIRDTANLIQQ
ncbi:MAG: RIP metalloprotease RseP [Scytolyngbya sp. HA4215-MV1]|jgi:RIP metalloprotease RseP|nr:RIP metalloprotease RseP [Scytolyngbya sp. HA4215-MV1]